MFKNLSVSAKLLILCSIVLVTFAVTTFTLLSEKQIALDFTKKELVGNRYIEDLRKVYAAILAEGWETGASPPDRMSIEGVLELLATADGQSAGVFETAGLNRALSDALRQLWSRSATGERSGDLAREALGKTRELIVRVGDVSNLTLDPDLDSYYVQDLVVTKIPALLGHLAEIRSLSGETNSAPSEPGGRVLRLITVEGLLRAAIESVQRNLAAAYRGNADGQLKLAVEQPFTAMISATRLYLASLATAQDGGSGKNMSLLFDGAVDTSVAAWASAQDELNRILQRRIDGLLANLYAALALIAGLVALSILVAFLTHRNIVKPLQRFEAVANKVRETKDYALRVDVASRDEIGRLAGAFNEMLSELSEAREREKAEQAELARVTRLVTMGAMTASIAHEVNQPLAAIVTNSNAALRWLALGEPDIAEANAALKRIVKDGHRASQVIASVRSTFKKEQSERTLLSLNDLVQEALQLAQPGIQGSQATVTMDLAERLPDVLADRVQLQQVLINLIINAAEAMTQTVDRERSLSIATRLQDGEVHITVADSGDGIDPEHLNRIFEPFFTTKASGMGLGLAICRSIVEAHGGRLWVTSSDPRGSTFHVALACRAESQ
jgi:signal transduction histidine kinase